MQIKLPLLYYNGDMWDLGAAKIIILKVCDGCNEERKSSQSSTLQWRFLIVITQNSYTVRVFLHWSLRGWFLLKLLFLLLEGHIQIVLKTFFGLLINAFLWFIVLYLSWTQACNLQLLKSIMNYIFKNWWSKEKMKESWVTKDMHVI